MRNLIFILAFLFLCCHKRDQHISTHVNFLLSKAADTLISPIRRLSLNKQALDLLRNTDNDSLNRAELFKVTRNFYDLKEYVEFLETSWKLKSKSISARDSSDIAEINRYLGQYYLNKNIYDSAYYYHRNAIRIYTKLGDEANLMRCYYNISILQSSIFDNWNAQLSAIKAYKYARDNKNLNYQLTSLMMQAIILNDLGEYDDAIEQNYLALNVAELTNDSAFRKESCMNNIGAVYQNSGNHKMAIKYFEKALSRRVEKGYPSLYARVLDNIAFSKMYLGNFENVKRMMHNALKIRLRLNADEDIITSHNHLAEYYWRRQNKSLAIYHVNEALSKSFATKQCRSILVSLVNASKIDKKNGSNYFQRYAVLSDSLQLAERKNRNKFARIAFETDEITVEKDKAIKQKWIVAGISGALLLLSILLFIIKMQRARQKRLLLIQEQQKADESIYRLINDQQLKVDEGRQAEKKRIARELHDGIMNRLASTRLNLFILNKNQDKETIGKCLGFINNIQDIEKEIRQVAHDLNHEIFSENKGFVLLLETLFEEYRNIIHIRLFTEIDTAFNWEMTESVLRMNIYRILQEALQNSYKYANAKNIFVTLTKEEDAVRIIVHDDGKGFAVNKIKKGFGLQSIADRAESLKGFFKIISGKQEGTILNILLPLKQ